MQRFSSKGQAIAAKLTKAQVVGLQTNQVVRNPKTGENINVAVNTFIIEEGKKVSKDALNTKDVAGLNDLAQKTVLIEFNTPAKKAVKKVVKKKPINLVKIKTCMKYVLVGKNHVKKCVKYSHLTSTELKSKKCSKYASTSIFNHLVSHGKPVIYKKYVNKGTVHRAYKPTTVKKAIKKPVRKYIRSPARPVRKTIRRPARPVKRPVRKVYRRPVRKSIRRSGRSSRSGRNTRGPVRRSTSRRYVRSAPRRISKARRLQTTVTTHSSVKVVSSKSYTTNHTKR